MDKIMRQKIPKVRSKKGMTLIELIVGITIIVIVFGATLSAMTNGYSNTIFNAEVNQTAVEGGSVNEIMAQTLKKQNFEDENACKKYFFGGVDGVPAKNPNTDKDSTTGQFNNAVHAAGVAILSDMTYVEPSAFPSNDPSCENQYTIITDAKGVIQSGAKNYTINGVELKTSVTNVRGKITNVSFISYTKQPK